MYKRKIQYDPTCFFLPQLHSYSFSYSPIFEFSRFLLLFDYMYFNFLSLFIARLITILYIFKNRFAK